MREILFRGKRKDSGKWCYGSLQRFKGFSIFDNDYKSFFTVSSTSIGQYTGLTDKNGNKIFEGDILNCYSPYDINGFRNSVVMWSDLFLGWRAGSHTLYGDEQQVYEVIGNIHDNPELLKGGAE